MSSSHECSYCEANAVARFRWDEAAGRYGQLRVVTIEVRACWVHEGCPNWQSLLDVHELSPGQVERL